MVKAMMKSQVGYATIFLLALVVGLSAPATADVVYSWTTEDGTTAFTDDAEKIPSRYASAVKEQSLESLRSYPRLTIQTFTPPPAVSAPPPSGDAPKTGSTASAEAGLSVLVGGTRFGANAAVVPVGRDAKGDAPMIIETDRVKPADSMATRHETVISAYCNLL